MAETAGSVVEDALQEAFISGASQPVQAFDMSRGIRYLNRMMAGLDARGISLGYTVLSSPSDQVTVPAGAIEGMVFNLALKIASAYGEPIGNDLRLNAREGYQAMLDLAVNVDQSILPCTMPVGSGNELRNYGYEEFFFPCEDPDILTEAGGTVNLEGGT